MKKLVLIAFLTFAATSLNAQKIFSVDAEYKAGWKNASKKHLLY
jgi:hypothetical protein